MCALQRLEYRRVTEGDLPYVSYLCLWGVSSKQKEAMKVHMEKRLEWIQRMWPKGLEIVVALGPRKSKKGLIEYLPIEMAPDPVKGEKSLWMNCIWVLPRFQKAGIGKGLIRHFLDEAKKVGGASVLAYEGDTWFGYFDYMPAGFFKQLGFREVSRDETRVLLHLDLGAHAAPKLLPAQGRRLGKKGQTAIAVFCNSQCPWCGWMADEINRKAEGLGMKLKHINTDDREAIEEFGLSRGIAINGKPVIKRMAVWREIKSAIESAASQ